MPPRLIASLVASITLAMAQEKAHAESWTVLKPVKMSSAGGATFALLSDGTILVGGPSPEKDVYTFEFETTLSSITAFKIEALADPNLPNHGPGRSRSGNFVMNEVVIEASAKNNFRYKPVILQNATADFVQPRFAATMVHDGEQNAGGNGWAVDGALGKNHELVVETKKDVAFDDATLVKVELYFNYGQQHTLGQLRISATNQPRPVRAAGASDEWARLQERINAAIDRGVDYLLTQQQIDGSWNFDQVNYRNGATALATYTLLKSGVHPHHPAIVRALECMRGCVSKETYTLGCQLMALGSLDDPQYLPWMTELADKLMSFQREGFSYPWGNVDLSNTQYGALGLRAAAMHGVKVPGEVWEKLATQALRFQEELGAAAYGPASFRYNPGANPTGSMTAAGVGILAICEEQTKGKTKSGAYLAAAKHGVEWLAQHWSVDQNPKESHDRWNTYYLYGLERFSSLMGLEEIGNHNWYREGARRLVDTQGGKGEWSSAYRDYVINTCFALLFLNKATAPASGKLSGKSKLYGIDDPSKSVNLRASGDTPLTMWLSPFGEKEQAKYEWPKEADRGLRVKKVEYVGRGADGASIALATIEKDGSQPSSGERFGARWSFALPGKYTIVARVTILAPPDPEGAAPVDVVIESAPIEVTIDEAIDPELVQYAKDPGRNLLAGQKITANASSTINGDWAPAFAVDNLQVRGWAAKNDDAAPTLTLELEKPVRATTLLVTPAKIGDEYGSRITRLAIAVNGKSPPFQLDVPITPDRRKVKLQFPQPQVVRKIELKITGRQECANPEKAVGIAEVELQAEKAGN